MIFDSVYDTYRGVVTYVRVIDGNLNPRERIAHDVDQGHPRAARDRRHPPRARAVKGLGVGEVGYLITGVKDVRQSGSATR
jgi:GTP-binding protein LepA